MVVLWSKISVSSEWVRIEAAEGKHRNILIPVRIEDVELPLAFRRRQFTDLIEWSKKKSDLNFRKLIHDINLIIGNNTIPILEKETEQIISKSPIRGLKKYFWVIPILLVLILGFSQRDKILNLFQQKAEKDISAITFNVGNEKLTLIYHSLTLSRKDTFDIDPNKTVKYLKDAIERHYRITIPIDYGQKLSDGLGNISTFISADHQILSNEYQNLKESGLKAYDVIEFEYLLDELGE